MLERLWCHLFRASSSRNIKVGNKLCVVSNGTETCVMLKLPMISQISNDHLCVTGQWDQVSLHRCVGVSYVSCSFCSRNKVTEMLSGAAHGGPTTRTDKKSLSN